MIIISIIDIINNKIIIGKNISIAGWLKTIRHSKTGISFLHIYDGSCIETLQIIAKNDLINYNNEIMELTTGCSLTITGKLIKSIGIKQKIELQAKKIKIIGWIDKPNCYPISSKHHTLEYLRNMAHLRPRTNIIGAVTRIRNNITQSIHKFMNKNGFLWISTPIITTLDTEGNGKMFKVSTLDLHNIPKINNNKINYKKDFFGKESFLTVSGQLNAECYACALSKVYTFGPTFRAENSNTKKHLSEFWMIELEKSFSDLHDIIEIAISLIKYIFKSILKKSFSDINYFSKQTNKNIIDRLNKFINNNFKKISYNQAITILKKNNKKFKNLISWGEDLSSEHEHFLTEQYYNCPIIIFNYPKNIKPFYMRINKDNKTVAAMDIIMPDIGEIIGGSQREERIKKLDLIISEKQLNKKHYWWYRDLRRYGSVYHSGFGMGLERIVSYITGLNNIKDVIPFPRTPKNAYF